MNRTSGMSSFTSPGLGAGRRDRLGIAALFEIGLREGDGVAALAQGLEFLHRDLARLAGAAPHQCRRQTVSGGGVERLGLDRRPQQRDRVVEAACLDEQLAQIDRRADIGRIELRAPA